MKITFLGHSCFLVESNGYTVIIDPYITNNPQATVKVEDIKVDAVLITHGHFDHIGDAGPIAKRNNCPVVSIYEIAMYLTRKYEVEVHPLGIGGAHVFPWGKVKLTQAIHSSGIQVDSGELIYGGLATGILLTMEDKTFYHAGDTALFYDMKLIGELHSIDVAALPVGDNFTMGIDESVIAASWLGAKQYIPMHYNSFELIKQDISTWKEKMVAKELDGVVLEVNESLTIK